MPTDQKVFILDQESLTPMPDANPEVTGMLGVAGPQVLDEGMVDEGTVDEGTMDGWMSVFFLDFLGGFFDVPFSFGGRQR